MLRNDGLAIWNAALEAVRSERLVRQALRLEGRTLHIADIEIALDDIDRIVVVGGGKAGAGMAAAVEDVLAPIAETKQLAGCVNVPADCVRPLRWIRLHPGRPAGRNEPTEAAREGTEAILQHAASLGPRDLCITLISGGGSALLVAPVPGLTVADLQKVTRFLSAAGADITQLNLVRSRLSRIKGGGLARACRAGRLAALIISDVLGDPIATIASGPTWVESGSHDNREEAIAILRSFGFDREEGADRIFDALAKSNSSAAQGPPRPACKVTHHIIGNNATAVDAAGEAADRLGYRPAMVCAESPEGLAEDVGRHLAELAQGMRSGQGPDCLITGGEPVVQLVEAARRGRGGRNQQLVLAAYLHLTDSKPRSDSTLDGLFLLSGGTDGEDGPTDAAGAWIDAGVHRAVQTMGLDPADHLARNDAYPFFEASGGLLRTGPTHTNVCDVRIVLVDRNGRRRAR